MLVASTRFSRLNPHRRCSLPHSGSSPPQVTTGNGGRRLLPPLHDVATDARITFVFNGQPPPPRWQW
ncbi:hypothetical protein SDJN03_05672, partial [Cucurbita argyrosperma subsp. sororia]